jgi:hypothetical protein
MTSMTKSRSYRLRDKSDPDVEFVGVLLDDATTETPEATRWTEVSIYRTDGGQYVIHRVGRSVLYHQHDGVCNTGIPIEVGDLDGDDVIDLVPCERCRPGEIDTMDDTTLINKEMDRYNVDVCQAESVAKTLELVRPDGTKFISHVAQRALLGAMNADPALRAAMANMPARKIS